MSEAGEATFEETTRLRDAPEGTRVLGVDGGKLGEVVAVYRDRLIVERGFFFPTDFYVPFAAVGEYAGGTIRLIVSLREALEFGWEAPPVDEPVPTAIAEAPEVVPTPSVPEPTPRREPAPSTAPPGISVPTPSQPRQMLAAEPPAPAPPAAESRAGAPPSIPAPAPPTPTLPDADEPVVSTPAEPAPAEPAATVATAEPGPKPAADRPKTAAPLAGAAGGSYLSRLFPDLVGQPAEAATGADPKTAAATTAAPEQPEPAAVTEPAVEEVTPTTEPAAAKPDSADAVEAPDKPTTGAAVEEAAPKAKDTEGEEPRRKQGDE